MFSFYVNVCARERIKKMCVVCNDSKGKLNLAFIFVVACLYDESERKKTAMISV